MTSADYFDPEIEYYEFKEGNNFDYFLKPIYRKGRLIKLPRLNKINKENLETLT
jgi:hypothetical protein